MLTPDAIRRAVVETRDDAYRLAAFVGVDATIIAPATVSAVGTFTIGTEPVVPPPDARTVVTEIGTVTWWSV